MRHSLESLPCDITDAELLANIHAKLIYLKQNLTFFHKDTIQDIILDVTKKIYDHQDGLSYDIRNRNVVASDNR